MISGSNIHKSYNNIEVLKGVELSVAKGEIVSVVGDSGAGKTTLLQILGTLDAPDTGLINIDGKNISGMSAKELASFRNKHIGFVFQFHHLLPEFTAIENVCLPALIGGESKKAAEEKANSLLSFLGLNERLNHKPSELSGGEQQRVAVARALINNPTVVLADEPSGNLDSKNAQELHKLFFSLREKYNQTFIIATHNKELAAMSDRKLTIRDGVII